MPSQQDSSFNQLAVLRPSFRPQAQTARGGNVTNDLLARVAQLESVASSLSAVSTGSAEKIQLQGRTLAELVNECNHLRESITFLENRLQQAERTPSKPSSQDKAEPLHLPLQEPAHATEHNRRGDSPVQQTSPASNTTRHNSPTRQNSPMSNSPMHAVQRFSESIKEHDELYTDQCVLEGSVWDGALFIGTRFMGRAGSAYNGLLLAFNVLMQLMFTVIVRGNLASFEYGETTLAAMRQWRLAVGHHLKNYDKKDGTSFVSRVCAGDGALEMSSSQRDTLELINEYLPRFDVEGHDSLMKFGFIGPTMSLMALSVWILSVSREWRRILQVFRALSGLPRGDKTEVQATHLGDGLGWELKAVNRQRIFLYNCTVLPLRGLIALALLYAGALYLIHTIDMGDLLLNAVALDFVLSIDEVVFCNLSPLQTRNLIAFMQALPMKQKKHYRGLDRQAPLALLFCCLLIVVAYFWGLQGVIASLEDVRDVLCSGKLSFVYTNPNFPPFYGWASTVETNKGVFKPAGRVWDNPDIDEVDRITADLITGQDNPLAWDTLYKNVEWTQNSLVELGTLDFASALYYANPLCSDNAQFLIQRKLTDSINEYMERKDPAPLSCDEALITESCHRDTRTGMIARMFCSQTCGCGTPNSSQVLSGCPDQCEHMPSFNEPLVEQPCTDTPVEVLRSSPIWRGLIRNIYHAVRENYKGNHEFVGADLLGLRDSGCQGVFQLRIHQWDICKRGHYPGGYPFRFFCPESCSCSAHMTACPHTCNATDVHNH